MFKAFIQRLKFFVEHIFKSFDKERSFRAGAISVLVVRPKSAEIVDSGLRFCNLWTRLSFLDIHSKRWHFLSQFSCGSESKI